VTVYSDGSCHGNPGAGGYAAIIVSGREEREITGAVPFTTNNRMELTAAIRALESLPEHTRVHMVTDSQYLKNGATVWIHDWIRRGWKTSSRKDVLNRDLWEKLLALSRHHEVSWEWVRGHGGHLYNERCDQLANAAIARLESGSAGRGDGA
jgi:ribonuclease HI